MVALYTVASGKQKLLESKKMFEAGQLVGSVCVQCACALVTESEWDKRRWLY